MKFEVLSLGKGMFVHTVAPEESLLQKMTHAIYCESSIPTWLAKLLVYAEAIQVLYYIHSTASYLQSAHRYHESCFALKWGL